jgi:hypothetical protein
MPSGLETHEIPEVLFAHVSKECLVFAGGVSVLSGADRAGELIRKMEDEVNHLLPNPQDFLNQLSLTSQSAKELYLSGFPGNSANARK